jgi:hypothetical protein
MQWKGMDAHNKKHGCTPQKVWVHATKGHECMQQKAWMHTTKENGCMQQKGIDVCNEKSK